MEINKEKLKIGGLVVIGALLILLARQEPSGLPKIPEQPAPPFEVASAQSTNKDTGTITGSISLPSTVGRQASVCAINSANQSIFCVEKVKQDYSLTVPTGTYTVYATVYDNPRDINGYRAYHTDSNHSPIKVEVATGQAVTQINPNDWSNRGDEKVIAMINALKPQFYTQLAVQTDEPLQPATPANPHPESYTTPQLVSAEQDEDGRNTGKRHKTNN